MHIIMHLSDILPPYNKKGSKKGSNFAECFALLTELKLRIYIEMGHGVMQNTLNQVGEKVQFYIVSKFFVF